MKEDECNDDVIIKECCQICEHYATAMRYCTKRKRGVAPFQYCYYFKMRGAGEFFEVVETE